MNLNGRVFSNKVVKVGDIRHTDCDGIDAFWQRVTLLQNGLVNVAGNDLNVRNVSHVNIILPVIVCLRLEVSFLPGKSGSRP